MRHANFGDTNPCFWRTGVRRGSAMVPLDRAFVSSYRLSMVTMSLTEAVWPQFAIRSRKEKMRNAENEMGIKTGER